MAKATQPLDHAINRTTPRDWGAVEAEYEVRQEVAIALVHARDEGYARALRDVQDAVLSLAEGCRGAGQWAWMQAWKETATLAADAEQIQRLARAWRRA